MSLGCWLCGTVNECNCPSPEEYEARKAAAERRRKQEAHEASVKKQRGKFKPAPWRTDKSRGDYQP